MADDYESLYNQGLREQIAALRIELHEYAQKQGEEITKLRERVGMLETTLALKSGIWGALSGVAAGLLLVLLFLLSRTVH